MTQHQQSTNTEDAEADHRRLRNRADCKAGKARMKTERWSRRCRSDGFGIHFEDRTFTEIACRVPEGQLPRSAIRPLPGTDLDGGDTTIRGQAGDRATTSLPL